MTIIVVVIVTMAILIKSNVTFSKEIPGEDGSSKSLEITSELVKDIYSSLTLLDDSLSSDIYRYAYFKMDSTEKELSPEEKLYITIENMYSENEFELTDTEEGKKTKVKADLIVDEANKIFKGEKMEPKNINFSPSLNCGIVGYLFTGTEYEFTFKECKQSDYSKVELESARKEGNYVILQLKSYYATYQKKGKKETEGHYIIKNYNSNDEIVKIKESEFDNRKGSITEDYPIDSYELYFELRGDDYVLSKIKLLKNKA